MSTSEIMSKEEYYKKLCEGILIPPDLTPAEALKLNSMIDQAITQVMFDYIEAKRVVWRAERDWKQELKRQMLLAKEQNIGSAQDKEAWAYVQALQYKTVFDIAERDYVFYEGVIDLLKSKKDQLVSDSGFMKLDAAVDYRKA